MADTDGTKQASKVARVIEDYALEDMGEYLKEAWTGENESRTSLRDLADEFNRAVLTAALREAGETANEYDVDATYRVLTDDDVSNADTVRKERELDRYGVDIDGVRNDFVTHQAIHTYLTKYREAELGDQSIDADAKVDTLERLEGRTAVVAESTLSTLVNAGEVSEREYELFVEVRAVCDECGSDYALVDLISQGGCQCD